MNREALDRLTAVRIQTVGKAPFYGLLGMHFALKEDAECKSMWCDGKTLGYSPAFVKSASWDELQGTFAKLCHHVVMCHHLRRDGRKQSAWQEACNRVVYPAIRDAEFYIPKEVYIQPGDAEKSAEELYSFIERDQENQQQQKPSNQAGDGAGESGDGEPGENDDEGDDQNNQPPGEIRDQKNQDGAEMSQSEKEEAEREALKTVAALAQQAKAIGKLPGAIERQVQKLLFPEMDWVEQLREFLKSLSNTDYSWMRPNRRFLHSGIYLPSLRSEGAAGTVVIAVDTSGSIDEPALSRFCAEVNDILESCRPEKIVAIFCDWSINDVREFDQDGDIDLTCRGGGGTNLCPPFEYVEEHGIVPDCFLYFTDLRGEKPEVAPPYPVMWVCPPDPNGMSPYYMPSFGRVIHLT